LWNFNTRGVPTLARRISRKLQRLREGRDIGRVHIVGHSMGGLVGRYLVQEEGGGEYIDTVITLGSPHQGTPTAFIGAGLGLLLVSHAMWQLFPMSPLVRRLNEGRFPEGCRLVSVYSEQDLVCPWRSSVLGTLDGQDVRNVLVKGLGHMQLVEDPWVYGLILRELVERPVDPASGPLST
jgi:triacylglycerol lipase